MLGFGKDHRLLSPRDFENLKVNCKKKRHGTLLAYFKYREEGVSRIGISVSAKHYGSTQRNKIKRTLREHFRKSQIKKIPVDILFVIIEKTAKKDFLTMVDRLQESIDFIICNILKDIKIR